MSSTYRVKKESPIPPFALGCDFLARDLPLINNQPNLMVTVFLVFQVHLRRVMHKDRFMRQSSILPAITNRIFRDLIHNPLHLLFSLDVLGMASSTLASLSEGFAELSTDGQFLQLRSKQVCFLLSILMH